MKKIYEKINKKFLLNIVIILMAYMATYFVPYIVDFTEELAYSNSILSLAIFISFIVLLKKTIIKENLDKMKNVSILGVIFAIFLVVGFRIKKYSTLDFKDISIYFAIISFSLIINCILVHIFKFIEKFESQSGEQKEYKLVGKKRYIAIFLIIIICWIPVFLGAYPGYFCYDAHNEYTQYMSGQITSWMPLVHVLFLGFIISIGENLSGSVNVGIAFYMFIQMIIVDICFTYCIYFLEKHKISKIVKNFSILYYMIFPVIVMFAICSSKDTIFSALMLLDIIIMLDALLDKEKFMKSKYLQIRFIIITFLAIIFRYNAIYAYVPFLIIFAIVLKKKEIIISITIIFILYAFYIVPLYTVLGVYSRKAPKAEAFSIPLQQISRVYNYNYEDLTGEEISNINKCIPSKLVEKYNPKCADMVKLNTDIKKIGYMEFFKMWLNIGLRNPRIICRFFFGKYTWFLVSRYYYRWI